MSKLGLLNNTIVHYHLKQYTKNNRMNQILMRGLFLTCTESSFYSCTHTIELKADAYLPNKERKIPLLGETYICSWWKIPILPDPLLGVNCLCALALPSPPAHTSCRKNIYLHTEDINMPTTSVGHNCFQVNLI
jgi:hypothetical protein